MNETSLANISIAEFLDRLASGQPTPGGGAAAALCAAIGAGLGQMVCELTLGKPAFASAEAQVRELLGRFARAAAAARTLIDEDAQAYADLAAAFKVPRSDPARPQRIAVAADVAACVPLEIAALAARARADVATLRSIGNPRLSADIDAAAAILRAAVDAALANVHANLPFLDAQRRGQVEQAMAALNQ